MFCRHLSRVDWRTDDTVHVFGISYCTLFTSEEAEAVWAETSSLSQINTYCFRALGPHGSDPSQAYSHWNFVYMYICKWICVCVCAPTLQKTQHLVSLGEGITLSDGMGRETGETLRFHTTWRWKQTGKNNTQQCDVLVSYSTQRRIKAFTLKLHPVPENLISQYPIISQHRRRCGLRGLH